MAMGVAGRSLISTLTPRPRRGGTARARRGTDCHFPINQLGLESCGPTLPLLRFNDQLRPARLGRVAPRGCIYGPRSSLPSHERYHRSRTSHRRAIYKDAIGKASGGREARSRGRSRSAVACAPCGKRGHAWLARRHRWRDSLPVLVARRLSDQLSTRDVVGVLPTHLERGNPDT